MRNEHIKQRKIPKTGLILVKIALHKGFCVLSPQIKSNDAQIEI